MTVLWTFTHKCCHVHSDDWTVVRRAYTHGFCYWLEVHLGIVGTLSNLFLGIRSLTPVIIPGNDRYQIVQYHTTKCHVSFLEMFSNYIAHHKYATANLNTQ